MYGLDCKYYEKEFKTIDELINNVMESGMDPNYEITLNGKGIGEIAWDFLSINDIQLKNIHPDLITE